MIHRCMLTVKNIKSLEQHLESAIPAKSVNTALKNVKRNIWKSINQIAKKLLISEN